MISVGSSSPRLGSIRRREKRERMAGAPSASARCSATSRGAQVVGDVAVKVLGPKPERAVALRDGVLGVVAEDEKAGRGVPVDAPIGLGAQVFLVKSVQTSLHATPRSRPLTCPPGVASGKKKA